MFKRSCKKSRLSKDELWALLGGVSSRSPEVGRLDADSERGLSTPALIADLHLRDSPIHLVVTWAV